MIPCIGLLEKSQKFHEKLRQWLVNLHSYRPLHSTITADIISFNFFGIDVFEIHREKYVFRKENACCQHCFKLTKSIIDASKETR